MNLSKFKNFSDLDSKSYEIVMKNIPMNIPAALNYINNEDLSYLSELDFEDPRSIYKLRQCSSKYIYDKILNFIFDKVSKYSLDKKYNYLNNLVSKFIFNEGKSVNLSDKIKKTSIKMNNKNISFIVENIQGELIPENDLYPHTYYSNVVYSEWIPYEYTRELAREIETWVKDKNIDISASTVLFSLDAIYSVFSIKEI